MVITFDRFRQRTQIDRVEFRMSCSTKHVKESEDLTRLMLWSNLTKKLSDMNI